MVKLLLISLFISASVSQTVSNCGVRQVVNKLIVNGYNAVQGEWPWHVALYKKKEGNESYACGGTLVTKLHVITAKHCVKNAVIDEETQLFGNIFVRLGVYWLNSTDELEQRRMIKKIHRFLETNLTNDIAILELDTEAEFGEYVQPACVSLTQDLTGQLGTAIGWGVDETDRISNVLKSARMPVVDVHTCLASDRALFGKKLDSGIFCAGYTNGTTVCNGDSGGGIFFEEDGVWYLGGIVAFAKFRSLFARTCFVRGYGAFTRIYKYICWIKMVTKLPIADDQCEDPDENYTELFPQDCGSNNNRESGSLEHPWMAILHYENDSYPHGFCEGTLIHKRYVLTHALCTAHWKPYQVRLGEHTIGQSYVRDYGIESFIHYPVIAKEVQMLQSMGGIKSLMDSVANATALIRLNRDVEFEDHIRPVCLPVTRRFRKLALPEYTTAGWGYASNTFPSATLLTATIKTNPAGCEELKQHVNISANELLCLDGPSRLKVCNQNIGGLLGANVDHQQRGERFVQFGVLFGTKFLLPCDASHAVKVGRHMDWIAANIRSTNPDP